MIYLSSSFVQKNYDLIKSSNCGILAYNNCEYNVEDIIKEVCDMEKELFILYLDHQD